jgi:hypothetical protein
VTEALQQGATISQMATTMVLLAADRMARTPVGMSPGWGDLSWEMTLASSLRTVERYAGFGVAARALYHVAWRFFGDRWLNIPLRDITEPLPTVASGNALTRTPRWRRSSTPSRRSACARSGEGCGNTWARDSTATG